MQRVVMLAAIHTAVLQGVSVALQARCFYTEIQTGRHSWQK